MNGWYHMKENNYGNIQNINRDKLISILTEELPVLRAKIGLSQDDVSGIVGISRQTYSAIETKKRKMTWATFISLVLFFEQNETTRPLIEGMGAFPDDLKQLININKR